MKKIFLVLSFLFLSAVGFSQVLTYDPSNPRSRDGLILRNQQTLQIYVIFEGTKRYIQTPETLNGLFKNGSSLIRDVQPTVINAYPPGAPVSTDSGFKRLTTTQQVFLREGTLLRWIKTIDVADKYQFRLQITENISSLNGYTVGNAIVD